MSPLLRIILACIGAIVIVTIVWNAAQSWYFQPRAKLMTSISEAEKFERQFTEEDRELPTMIDQLQSYADRSLGNTREEVDAALRARLNRIKEELGLQSAVVSTGQFKVYSSPAQRSINRNNPFRNDPDLCELQGTISGRGSLETVMQLAHRIEAEPWMKRIDSYAIDPDPSGTEFNVTVRLTTMFLPDVVPDRNAVHASYDDATFGPYLAFAQAEPFRVPPPPTPQQPEPATTQNAQQTDTEPAPRFNYREWSLTALTQGRNGYEAWLVNRKSNESMVLAVGQSLNDMSFVSASADGAEFVLGENRFLITVGDSLADRSPVSR